MISASQKWDAVTSLIQFIGKLVAYYLPQINLKNKIMRIHKQFYKSIALSSLLFTGFAVGSMAQDTTNIVMPEIKTPVILSTTPTGGEKDVHLAGVIEITFSTDMDETTLNSTTFFLHAAPSENMNRERTEMIMDDERRQPEMDGYVKGTISYSDKIAVFTPDEELKEGTVYTFTVTNGVHSSDHIALANDQEWTFTTEDNTDSAYTENQDREYGMDRMDRMDRDEHRMNNSDTTQNGNNMIDLGKAGQFVILAKTDINNESGSMITGRTGEGSKAEKTKKEDDYTEAARQRISGQVLVLESNRNDTSSSDVNEAIEDMMLAYDDATFQNGADSTFQVGIERSEQNELDSTSHKNEHFQGNVLTPGVHEWDENLNLDSDVTLSGSADDVWLFKISKDLIIDENVVFTLTDGASADNVFWYVEGEVTIGKNAQFEGIILSMNDITLEDGAKLNGRMFSQASITLNENTVTEPGRMTGRTSTANE